MQRTHFRGQRRLVTHGRWHAAQQSRHLATSLGEAEDVVHEEQDILAAAVLVAELLGHGEARERHAQARTWRLVHLAEDQCHLRVFNSLHVDFVEVPLALGHVLLELVAILDDTTLDHLAQQVVALASALAHTGKHRVAVQAVCNVVDELLNEHCFAHTGTAEEADLAALGEGLDKVDNLDASVKNLLRNRQVGKSRRWLVNGATVTALEGLEVIDRLPYHVEQTAFHLFAGRYRYRLAQVFHLDATLQSVGTVHGNTSHGILADVLLDLKDDLGAVLTGHRQCGVDVGDLAFVIESNVDHRSDYLRYFSITICHNHENKL